MAWLGRVRFVPCLATTNERGQRWGKITGLIDSLSLSLSNIVQWSPLYISGILMNIKVLAKYTLQIITGSTFAKYSNCFFPWFWDLKAIKDLRFSILSRQCSASVRSSFAVFFGPFHFILDPICPSSSLPPNPTTLFPSLPTSNSHAEDSKDSSERWKKVCSLSYWKCSDTKTWENKHSGREKKGGSGCRGATQGAAKLYSDQYGIAVCFSPLSAQDEHFFPPFRQMNRVFGSAFQRERRLKNLICWRSTKTSSLFVTRCSLFLVKNKCVF